LAFQVSSHNALREHHDIIKIIGSGYASYPR